MDSTKLSVVRGFRNQLLRYISHPTDNETEDDLNLLMMEMNDTYLTLMQYSLLSSIISRDMKRACFHCQDLLISKSLIPQIHRTNT